MKIDVEGAEHLVLSGGRDVIRRFKPTIILESNLRNATPEIRESTNCCLAMLKELEYNVYLVGGHTPRSFNAEVNASNLLAVPSERSDQR